MLGAVIPALAGRAVIAVSTTNTVKIQIPLFKKSPHFLSLPIILVPEINVTRSINPFEDVNSILIYSPQNVNHWHSTCLNFFDRL